MEPATVQPVVTLHAAEGFPVAAIVILAVVGYLILFTVLLVVRQCLIAKTGSFCPSWCTESCQCCDPADTEPGCLAKCAQACNYDLPNKQRCLDMCCPSKQSCDEKLCCCMSQEPGGECCNCGDCNNPTNSCCGPAGACGECGDCCSDCSCKCCSQPDTINCCCIERSVVTTEPRWTMKTFRDTIRGFPRAVCSCQFCFRSHLFQSMMERAIINSDMEIGILPGDFSVDGSRRYTQHDIRMLAANHAQELSEIMLLRTASAAANQEQKHTLDTIDSSDSQLFVTSLDSSHHGGSEQVLQVHHPLANQPTNQHLPITPSTNQNLPSTSYTNQDAPLLTSSRNRTFGAQDSLHGFAQPSRSSAYSSQGSVQTARSSAHSSQGSVQTSSSSGSSVHARQRLLRMAMMNTSRQSSMEDGE